MNELFYQLLPEFIRYKDSYEGEPLRALLAVLDDQYDALHANLADLYESWFIETCAEWQVPYLADLVGVTGLGEAKPLVSTQRTRVANTLAYRRRKGIGAVLARAAQDVTGWCASAVPYAPLVGRTQSLEHLQLGAGGTVDLRDAAALDALASPFNTIAHGVDVDRPSASPGQLPAPSTEHGEFNLPNLGLFFWRLEAYPMSFGTARRIHPAGLTSTRGRPPGCYTFHPFGIDIPLFNQPETASGVAYETTPRNAPAPLGRRTLAAEQDARRRGLPPPTDYLGPGPVLRVLVRRREDPEPVPVERRALGIADLSDWRSPRPLNTEEEEEAGSSLPPVEAWIDPELGRLLLPKGAPEGEVYVSYKYGFSADLGGGPYDRHEVEAVVGERTWLAIVYPFADAPAPPDERASAAEKVSWTEAVSAPGAHQFRTLAEALVAWELAAARFTAGAAGAGGVTGAPEGDAPSFPHGVIRIADSSSYVAPEGRLRIAMTPGLRLVIEGAAARCPCLVGDLEVAGATDSAFTLQGLWIDGGVRVRGACDLAILHCTLRPPSVRSAGPTTGGGSARASLELDDGEADELRVSIERSILGPIRLPTNTARLIITDSIVDAAGGTAISGPAAEATGPSAALLWCTVLGDCRLTQLPQARDVLFTGPVRVEQPRFGEVRYCYLPQPWHTPRRMRCQPETALAEAAGAAEVMAVARRLVPAFTSLAYGDAGYAQLRRTTPSEIARGAEDGCEMGAFHLLYQPQREADLPGVLDEYVRWGFDARVFFVT